MDRAIIDAVLTRGCALLEQARRDHASWELLRPTPMDDPESGQRDPRALDRRQLAWALQYDHTEDDGPLLRFLLEQETAWREVDPWQGIGDTLEIAAWLVAREPREDDVWLMARAKRANFDTECGFDREHLFATGVEATLSYVRASAGKKREELLCELVDDDGAPYVDESRLEEWCRHRARCFPSEPSDNAMVWFQRALAIDELAVARVFLEQWGEGQERSPRHLRALSGLYAELDDWSSAASTLRDAIAQIDDAFDRASALASLACAERRAGNPAAALDALRRAAALHDAHPGWRELGLARAFIEESFRTALASPTDTAQGAFALADSRARAVPRLPLVTLEAAVAAARHVGDASAEAHYEHQGARLGSGEHDR